MAYYPNTTKKARDFCSEEMAGKSVDKVPGIGPVLRGRLEEDGYSRAEHLQQKAREFNFDENKFQGWMTENYGASSKHAADCYRGLRCYEVQFGNTVTTPNRGQRQSRDVQCYMPRDSRDEQQYMSRDSRDEQRYNMSRDMEPYEPRDMPRMPRGHFSMQHRYHFY